MKKTLRLMGLCALAVLALAGCKKNVSEPKTSIQATISQLKGGTRTGVNSDKDLVWNNTDQIKVYNGTEASAIFTTEDDDVTSAEFTSTETLDVTDGCVAFYPAADVTVSEGNYDLTLKAVQDGAANTFAPGTYPMYALYNNGSFDFQSPCALLGLPLKGDATIGSIVLTSTNPNEKLSGYYSFVPGDMIFQFVGTTDPYPFVGIGNSVALDFGENGLQLTDTPTTVYFTLPAFRLADGFTVVFKGLDGSTLYEKTAGAHEENLTSAQTILMMNEPVTVNGSAPAPGPYDPLTTPLTFEARETVPVTVAVSNYDITNYPLEFSINGGAWTLFNGSVTLENKGDIVQFRGNNSYFCLMPFTCTQQCYIYGNVMSLLHKDDYATNYTFTDDYGFTQLFMDNTNIDLHPVKELVLPATTLVPWCYVEMFQGCTGLTRVPELPATTLANGCYSVMFDGCTSLTTVPDDLLPVTNLITNCYNGMFHGCTGLTAAPTLPAPTLAINCYWGMFEGCTNLNSVTCLAIDISASNCTLYWLKDVPNETSRTFTKTSGVDWPTGSDGIPSQWTVENEDPTAPVPTLAQTLTTAGITVKVSYNYKGEVNFCQFISNGDGTYTFQYGSGYAGEDDECAKALVVEGGNLVFKQNYWDTIDDEWDNYGFSVTFDTSNNTYTQWHGVKVNSYNPYFISLRLNGYTISVTPAK